MVDLIEVLAVSRGVVECRHHRERSRVWPQIGVFVDALVGTFGQICGAVTALAGVVLGQEWCLVDTVEREYRLHHGSGMVQVGVLAV